MGEEQGWWLAVTTEAIEQEIRDAYLRLKQAEATVRFVHDHYLDDLVARFDQRAAEIEAEHARAVAGAESELAERLSAAEDGLAASGATIREELEAAARAYPWAMAGWDEPVWEDFAPAREAPPPACVRVGGLHMPELTLLPPLPALARLAGGGHLFIAEEDGEAERAREVLQAVVLRLMVSSRPGAVRLVLADALGQGASLAAFLRLPEKLRSAEVLARQEDLSRELEALAAHVRTVIQTRLVNVYANIEEYNAGGTGAATPYVVLALADFPAGFNDRMAQLLLDVARTGPRAGVYVVATINAGMPVPREFDLASLTRLGTTIRLRSDGLATWDDAEFGGHEIVPDGLPSPARVNLWLARLGTTAVEDERSLPFGRIAVGEADGWTGDATRGLEVPIGIAGTGEVQTLVLGQGVVQHGLIGGPTQSGKTNLLHVLVTQLALKYGPEEVEFYLLDFKEGVEFQVYLAGRLPHLRVVALESDPEFGVNVLRRLREEIEERGKRFRRAGVGTYVDFRRGSGERLPRVLAILDEFQVLFADERVATEERQLASEAGRLLEDVARRGAAFGIHLLLVSQTPGGAQSVRRSLFEQLALRISFKHTADAAGAVLGESAGAVEELRERGELVFNAEQGRKAASRIVRTPELPLAERLRLVEAIAARAVGRPGREPATFDGQAVARLEDNPELRRLLAEPEWPARTGQLSLWLGEPVEIKEPTAAVMERYVRSNLLVAGGSEVEAYGLLLAAVVSIAAQRGPEDAVLTIADFARPESPVAGVFGGVREALPHAVRLVGPRDANGALAELIAELGERVGGGTAAADQFLVIAGLHRWRELRGDGFQQTEQGKQLARLLDEGPEMGMHVIAWTDGVAALDRALKRGGAGVFDLRAILRVGESDSAALLGSPVAARLRDNRALFRHEDWELGRVEKFKPYGPPDGSGNESLPRLFSERFSPRPDQ